MVQDEVVEVSPNRDLAKPTHSIGAYHKRIGGTSLAILFIPIFTRGQPLAFVLQFVSVFLMCSFVFCFVIVFAASP